VDAHRILSSEFLKWDKYKDTLYKVPEGVTKEPHCFKFVKRDNGILYYQDYDGESWSSMNLLKPARPAPVHQQRLEQWLLERQQRLAQFPATAEAPGMKEIKTMELWSKWRKFVPRIHRTDPWFSQEPGQLLEQRVRQERTGRTNARRNAATTAAPAADQQSATI